MKTLNDVARAAGFATLPPGGAWVAITGCPIWPRGQRILSTHRDAGIQHMDIYWATKEVPTAGPRVNRRGRRNREIIEQMYFDIAGGTPESEAFNRAVEEYTEFIVESPHHRNDLQTSYITISHPHPEEVRFFNGEVSVFDAETIRLLLGDNQIETIFFGQSTIPVLEEALREIVDALQVDGLSHAEAYHMALTNGVITPDDTTQWVPTWFYRPCGWYRNQFCEEVD